MIPPLDETFFASPSTGSRPTDSAPPVALTIAGSDSGGGAGIQADLKTFEAFGVFGASAVTAITAQNTLGVTAVHPVPLETIRAQIDAVASDLDPSAVKSGMLASAGTVEGVARALHELDLGSYVLDPVMVASSGDRLLDRSAERALARLLVPLSTLVTPNLAEAAMLTGTPVEDPEGMERAGVRLLEMGAGAALVKGGHLPGAEVTDVLVGPGGALRWRRPKIATRHTHGTGCTLSAACTAGLALGRPLEDAVRGALDYVAAAIRSAPGLGAGHGPLNHRPERGGSSGAPRG